MVKQPNPRRVQIGYVTIENNVAQFRAAVPGSYGQAKLVAEVYEKALPLLKYGSPRVVHNNRIYQLIGGPLDKWIPVYWLKRDAKIYIMTTAPGGYDGYIGGDQPTEPGKYIHFEVYRDPGDGSLIKRIGHRWITQREALYIAKALTARGVEFKPLSGIMKFGWRVDYDPGK